jgi:signal transduction histidine kinase
MHNPVPDRVRRRPLLDHFVSLVFFLLVAASAVHLIIDHTAQCSYVLALCSLIAAGYWSGLAVSDRLPAVGRVAWLGALTALWLTLVAVTPGLLPYAYLWCAVPLACLAVRTLGERTALAATVVISCIPALLLLRLGDQLEPDGIVAPLVAVWATVGLFRLQRRDALTRQRLLDELQDVQDELERRQRAAGALAERARIARDLHDTLAQELSGSRMLLQAAERDRTTDPDRAWRHVHLVSEALGEHLAETRRIIDDLTPAQLEDTSLETALRDLCARAQRDGAAHRITFTGDGLPRTIGPEAAKALLRVAQGALANVREHAKAENVLVILSTQSGQTVLQVRDDGIGFSPARTRSERGRGFGLPALRERIRSCGGTFSLESAVGRGTLITAALPNPTDAAAAERRPATDLTAVAA